MEFHTFGYNTNPAIVFIHGMLTPWQIWDEAIEYFQKDYFVIVPELDGHTEEKKSSFQTVEQEAEIIKKYLSDTVGGKVFMVCGLSMGGRIAATLAGYEDVEIENLVLDGAPLCSVTGLMKLVMKNNYISIVRKSKQRDFKTMESFKKVFLPEKHLANYLRLADNMEETSIHNMIYSIFNKFEYKDINSNCRILFMHGTKGNESVSRKAALKMKEVNSQTEIKCYKGYAHAYLACFEPQKWIGEVSQWLKTNLTRL